MASLNFNANDVDPSSGSGAMPAGDYELHVIEANLKPNSKGSGQLLELTFEVLSGEFSKRKVWERLNIVHENPTAQKIGQENLSAICRAIGQMEISETDDLLWKPFYAALKVETYTKQDGSTGEKNAVKKYHFEPPATPPESKPAAQPSPSTARQTQNGGAPASKPGVPWER